MDAAMFNEVKNAMGGLESGSGHDNVYLRRRSHSINEENEVQLLANQDDDDQRFPNQQE